MVTLIAVRIFECNNEANNKPLIKEVVKLLLKIRTIVNEWIERIERAIHDMHIPNEECERQLRTKLSYVAIIGALTFFVSSKHHHFRVIKESRKAPQQWLHFIITLKSNMLVFARNETQLPTNLRMFLRLIERIGVDLEETMRTLITRNRQQICELIRMQWPRSNYASDFESVDFHSEYREILTVIAVVDDVRQIVTIDIITGLFLVNGLPLSRLPTYILESDMYRWFFGEVAFEVQPNDQKSFSTTKKYNDCVYEFQKINEETIIIERNDNGITRELIHYNKLKGKLLFAVLS